MAGTSFPINSFAMFINSLHPSMPRMKSKPYACSSEAACDDNGSARANKLCKALWLVKVDFLLAHL